MFTALYYKTRSALGFCVLSVCLHGAVLAWLTNNATDKAHISFQSASQPTTFEATFVRQAVCQTMADASEIPLEQSVAQPIIKSQQSDYESTLDLKKIEETNPPVQDPLLHAQIAPTEAKPDLLPSPPLKTETSESRETLAEAPHQPVAEPLPPESRPTVASVRPQTGRPGADTSQASADHAPTALKCPFPRYPRIALRKALEGIVLLEVTILEDGVPESVSVKKSSGHQFFDKEASRAVKSEWVFARISQATRTFDVTIRFELE